MPDPGTAQAIACIEGYLASLEGGWRRVAAGEWGLALEAAGWPLDVGLALRRGLVRAQGEVLAPGRVGDHELLHRNRGLHLVRYTHAGDGTVWVEGDLPAAAVTAPLLDGLLGSLVAAATVARERTA